MLAREQAREQLKSFLVPSWLERRKADAARLPHALRPIATAALDLEQRQWDREAAGRKKADERWQKLSKIEDLDGSARERVFTALFPRFGRHASLAWDLFPHLPYQAGTARRAFRAPSQPELHRMGRLAFLDALLRLTANYEPDLPWLAAWAPHLTPWNDRPFGLLFAAAISEWEADGQAVYEILLASARGEHPIGAMGRHVTRALLTASRPEGWAFVEQLLLAAQRQEGLRQVVLETIDEAHPIAFRRMLRLMVEHDLVRFSAAIRAASVWFGINWDVTRARPVATALERALLYLEDAHARAAAIEGGEAEAAYLALWALATEDAPAAIGPAAQLLTEPGVERRFAAVHLLSQLGLPAAQLVLLPTLDDEDLRVAAPAAAALHGAPSDLGEGDLFERLERNLPRFPKSNQSLEAPVWPRMQVTAGQPILVQVMLAHLGERSPRRLIEHLPRMEPGQRTAVAARLAELKTWDAEVREVFFRLVGDASPMVREAALRAVGKHASRMTSAEVEQLEGMLNRQASDLRRGVITLLQSQKEAAAFLSADRLLAGTPAQRLAGLDLLDGLQRAGRQPEQVLARARAFQASGPAAAQSSDEAARLERLLAGPARAAWSLDDALGLMDRAQRTPPLRPRAKGGLLSRFFSQPLVTPAARALRQSLDELIHARRETPIPLDAWQGTREELLGNAAHAFPQPSAETAVDADAARLPLKDVWERWWAERPAAQRDADGLELVRALPAPPPSAQHQFLFAHMPNWIVQAMGQLFGPAQALNYPDLIHIILLWLLRLHPPPGAADFLLGAVEATLALVPNEELIRKPEPKDRPFYYYSDWRSHHFLLAWLGLARQHRDLCPADWATEQHARLWGLLCWLDEPTPESAAPDARLPRLRPPLPDLIAAVEAGVTAEADLYDYLLGPRPILGYGQHNFLPLHQLTGRKAAKGRDVPAALRAAADRCRERILEVELARGDLPTAASPAALSLRCSGGLSTLAPLLRAWSRGKFVRGWVRDSQSRDAVFSHLARASYPAEEDIPEAFAGQLSQAGVSERRLMELALYAPQWARHVEHALGWPSLESAVWWLYAHTKDRRWMVDEEIREGWAAAIGERTPLSGADLLDGAVDVEWFQRVCDTIGAKRWEALSAAAQLTSGGQGHARARLFADAMLGRASRAALLKRIAEKRHQDAVRALGLLPLPAGPEREAEVEERYQAIQALRQGTRQFGSQRQASEKLAARIGLENLARTAGYPDPQRLEWALEARAGADLAGGPLTVEAGEVTLALSVDDLGQPELAVTKAGRALKSIPPKLKKDERVVALLERKRELGQQKSRVRQSLEEAMCRGDVFSGLELRAYFAHPVLRPMLSQLILVGDGLMGYAVEEGQALERLDGASQPLSPAAWLRIAHPHDLLLSGEWSRWQHACFVRERIQPFKQVFREVYVLTAAEKDERTLSRRYAGHQVNPRQALALLTGRGWLAVPEEGIRRTFHAEGLSAWLAIQGGAFTPLEVEGLTLEGVVFTRPGAWQPVDLAEVPPRLFSEVMRDLDLVVSVAHMGGVDPEASASTVEMRATLLRETCGLLGLDNVRLQPGGHHALVDGQLGHYSVHLGSAVVHRQPGGALCLVPVHSQHRGRLFLPFADDDPRTAEVLSKALLLARDQEIRDPTILEQILGPGA